MSGKKGKSGRKPFITQNDKEAIIHKAWNKINYKLGMSDPQAFAIAKEIASKDMVAKQQVSMEAKLSTEERKVIDSLVARRRQSIMN